MNTTQFRLAIVAGITLELALLQLLSIRANPFETTQVVGEIISVDATRHTGLVEADGRLLLLRTDGETVGGLLAAGCSVRAQGAYAPSSRVALPVFKVTVLVVQACHRSAGMSVKEGQL